VSVVEEITYPQFNKPRVFGKVPPKNLGTRFGLGTRRFLALARRYSEKLSRITARATRAIVVVESADKATDPELTSGATYQPATSWSASKRFVSNLSRKEDSLAGGYELRGRVWLYLRK
jgi:hypothetical protein